MIRNAHIERAIALAGSQPKLARSSGLSQQHISKLVRGQRSPTAEVAVALERATNGAIGRWEIRPDLWDPPAAMTRAGGSFHPQPEAVAP